MWPRDVAVAVLAAVLWLLLGLWRGAADGEPWPVSLADDAPLAVLAFVLALAWIRWRRRRR